MRYSSTILILISTLVPVSLCVPAVAKEKSKSQNLLLNSGVETGKGDLPSIWAQACVPADGLRMWRDTTGAFTGKACLVIQNKHTYDQPVSNNWMQQVQAIPHGKTVQIVTRIRTKDADAVNVCVQCWCSDGKNMLGFASTPVLRGNNDWTLLKSNLLQVPEETASMIVRCAMTGKGEAYFDDIELNIVSSRKKPSEKSQAVTSSESGELSRAVDGNILQTLPVTMDQMILAYIPNWAHGKVDNIAVANNDGGVRLLIQLPGILQKYKADKDCRFLLALYSRKTTVNPKPGSLGAYAVLSKWNESTSWQTAPKVSPKPAETYTFVPGDGWKIFDVSPIVRGKKNFGLMLRFDKENLNSSNWSGYAFPSREAASQWKDKRPVLLVVTPAKHSPKK